MSTISNIHEAVASMQDLCNVVGNSQGFPFATSPTTTDDNAKENKALTTLNVEIDSIVLSFKTSIKNILGALSEEQINSLNVQSISRLFSDDYKASLIELIKNK